MSRATGSKLRSGAGLSKLSHDSHASKQHSSTSGKDKDATKESTSTDGASSAAPVKRKREALGEVTTKNVKGPKAPLDKENHHKTVPYVEVTVPPLRTTRPAGAAAPPAGVSSRPTVVIERRVASASAVSRNRPTRLAVKEEEVKEEAHEQVVVEQEEEQAAIDEDAMVIDESAAAPVRASRRLSTRIAAPTTSTAGATSRRTVSVRRTTTTTTSRTRRVKQEDQEEETVEHVAKKLRTSSPGLDETVVLRDTANGLSEDMAEAQANALIEEAKWDDLDKEDEGDPLMVSEYVVEIFAYLQHLETLTMPNPNYIDTQKDLAWKMRGILMDWLIQVHARFRLLPETLFLAVNIIDRFLSVRGVALVRLQLVGVTAMFIAAKYEEIMAPSVNNFIYCSDSTYGEKDILDAEKYILRNIEWNLSYPNPINFLRRSSKADGYDLQVRTIAKYMVEISCVDWRFLPHTPSKVAAAGMWFARLVLDKEEWVGQLNALCFRVCSANSCSP